MGDNTSLGVGSNWPISTSSTFFFIQYSTSRSRRMSMVHCSAMPQSCHPPSTHRQTRLLLFCLFFLCGKSLVVKGQPVKLKVKASIRVERHRHIACQNKMRLSSTSFRSTPVSSFRFDVGRRSRPLFTSPGQRRFNYFARSTAGDPGRLLFSNLFECPWTQNPMKHHDE